MLIFKSDNKKQNEKTPEYMIRFHTKNKVDLECLRTPTANSHLEVLAGNCAAFLFAESCGHNSGFLQFFPFIILVCTCRVVPNKTPGMSDIEKTHCSERHVEPKNTHFPKYSQT